MQLELKRLMNLTDELLFQLCESGIYLRDDEISPKGYYEIAKSGKKLDEFLRLLKESNGNVLEYGHRVMTEKQILNKLEG